jgi:hypothetical protein
MTRSLRFDLMMREMRARAAAEPKQLSFGELKLQAGEDAGVLRLSRIAAVLRQARADSSRE